MLATSALKRFEFLAVYGQISKKGHFVRKIRMKSWRTAQNKKKTAPSSLARILNIILLRTEAEHSVAQSLRTGS